MAENEYNWDNLSDEDWNKKLDEHIARFNDGRGEIKTPPPAHVIMDNEYERGIKYTRGKFQLVVPPGQYWYMPWFTAIRKLQPGGDAPGASTPRKILFVREIPKGATGKILKRAIDPNLFTDKASR